MSATLERPISSIDLGYGGMFRMRSDIAALADAELGQHYEAMRNSSVRQATGIQGKTVQTRAPGMISFAF